MPADSSLPESVLLRLRTRVLDCPWPMTRDDLLIFTQKCIPPNHMFVTDDLSAVPVHVIKKQYPSSGGHYVFLDSVVKMYNTLIKLVHHTRCPFTIVTCSKVAGAAGDTKTAGKRGGVIMELEVARIMHEHHHRCANSDCILAKRPRVKPAIDSLKELNAKPVVEVMQRCGQCKSEYYCSKECQMKRWKGGHKHMCTAEYGSAVVALCDALRLRYPSRLYQYSEQVKLVVHFCTTDEIIQQTAAVQRVLDKLVPEPQPDI